jgi:hypothetical protein
MIEQRNSCFEGRKGEKGERKINGKMERRKGKQGGKRERE